MRRAEHGRFWVRLPLVVALAVAAAGEASASEPLTVAGGRLTLGGEISATLSPDDPGFFNYNDYERSLRRLRFGLTARLRAGENVAILGEVVSENLSSPRAYALYLRVRPWKDRPFDVQAGLVPPVFGAFARRRYGSDNPLIGYPLAYQYLTSVRPDAAPATADDLLEMRGEGWWASYPIGDPSRQPGSPLASAVRWDAGVQVRAGSEPFEVSAAVTQGTLSHPRVRDDNDGKQVSARVAWRPTAGLVLGVSGSRGEYLTRELQRALNSLGALPPGGSSQRAWGVDVEYSSGYWLVRGEAIWSDWDMPAVRAPFLPRTVRGVGLMGEGRYKVAPGLYVAARIDHLGFSRIRGSNETLPWDAPVTRMEGGVGYSLRRNLLLKAVYQRNRRDAGEVRHDDLGAGQLAFWF